MKAYKRITSSGGVSIPVGIRRAMGIQCQDAMELEVTEKNHQIRCIFCGNLDVMSTWKGKGICKPCLAEIVKGAKSDVTD